MNSLLCGLLTLFLNSIIGLDAVNTAELSSLQGECRDGTFGYKCTFRCKCKRFQTCNKITGECFKGCADGFWGPGCQLSNNCFYNGRDKTYMGTKSVTDSLFICQRWDSQNPHRHSYVKDQFPDRKLPENYCRSTEDSSRPWCYTSDKGTRWEHCNVNNCNCPAGRFGENCAKECHCADLKEACDSILGVCASGCAEGWSGYDCQEPISCPSNRFGWDCSKRCFCKDPRHCNRFTGPTKTCKCVAGYFNPPFCQAVTPPKILHFTNVKVNPGQNTTFNCTVTSFPSPNSEEIQVRGPPRRNILRVQTGELLYYMYTRFNIYTIDEINSGERFTCITKSIAGTSSKTITASLYELPRLSRPPTLVEEGRDGRSLRIQWDRFDPDRDTGDPPVMWYAVKIRGSEDIMVRDAGIVLDMNCQYGPKCTFNITDLTPNIEYTIRITTKRYGEGGEGPMGPALYTTTHCGMPRLPPVLQKVSAGFEYNSSFPETQLIIMWRDPPQSSWNCNNITYYQIFVTSTKRGVLPRAVHVSGNTPGDMNNVKSASISDLEPSTEYCVRMSFQNTQNHYSPDTTEKCTTTPSTTPTAPVNLRIAKRTSSSITITFDKPLLPPAPINTYQVEYWKGELKELTTKTGVKVHSPKAVVDTIIEDLEPYTKYQIQVRAKTSAGIGDPSPILTAMTEESIPGPITVFRNTSRTPRSVSLQWGKPSATNGKLLYFLLSCFPVRSMLNKPDHLRETRVEPFTYSHTFGQLIPATEYFCSVNASTNKGSGPSSRLVVWTDPLEPKDPPTPNIMDETKTTITIQLRPLEDTTVSFYRIIVERVSGKRSKRSIPESIRNVGVNFHQARATKASAYIAAELKTDQVSRPFVVGDNKTYGGYDNVPLSPENEYNIWYAAFSNVDGSLRKSFAKAERVSVGSMKIASAPDSNHIPVIIVVLVVFILLILVFALLLFLWRKRHIASEREKAEMPNFGPTIIPEPETSTPSTPVDDFEIEPLIERSTGTPTDNECDPLYGNTGLYIVPPVKVEDLWDYVKQSKENEAEGLRREYRLIPAGLTASCEVAKKTENKNKNRYGNIIAYDHTRVVLKPVIPSEIHDDYTNANYIDGYKKTRAYIAAQGPTKPTIDDIWRMAWQERSKTIIMLTNPTETGKKKCEQYWPDKGKETYAGILVELLDEDHLPDFTIRTFQLSKDGESMKVKQFHYTTWPDHGVPRFGNSLLLLRQKVRSHDSLDAGPPIVHCSAGVGRTGTYTAVDVNLEQAKNEGIIDVHNFVQLMRTQRVNMVQTIEQYMFVYDVLLEALICGDTTISTDKYCDTLSELLQYEQSIGKTKLDEQFDVLRLVTATIERDESTSALRPENIFKNRLKGIIPANRCRPYLHTPVEDYNDYINAIFLNGWRRRDAHIITQMPMPNTVVDFWRLIYDHNSYCIVMLNEIDVNDEMMEQYWTLDTCGEKYGPFIVETTAEIKSDPSITVRDFTVTNTNNPQEVPRVVRQFHFHRWPEVSVVPSSKVALLELLDQVESWQKQTGNKPVTVHCLDGATRSGLFVASSCILERIKWEKEVDVFQAIKQMRLNRPQLIDSIDQYKFCHEIALEYLNTINTLTTFS